MQVASGKGTRGKGDQEGGGIPGRHQEPNPWRGQPGSSSAVTQNTLGTLVPRSLPSVGLESIVSARSWSRADSTTDNGPSVALAPTSYPEGCGERPLAHAALRMRQPPSRRPPAQPGSLPVAVATGSRGGRGRSAAAAISAASCSSRPRRHGNRVTQLGRLPARLARVTPATRAPSYPSRTLPGARGRQGGRLMGDAY